MRFTRMIVLLFATAIPILTCTTGPTALIKAADRGNTGKVRALLENGANVNVQDDYGWTALMNAVYVNTEMVQVLLDAGADVNVKEICGETALHLAADVGFCQIIEVLLDAGADVNLRNSDGNTALMIAEMNNNTEAARILRQYEKKLSALKDYRIAVIGIKAEEIGDEKANAISNFIANAFVNTSIIKVVDRTDILRIIKEQELQQSAIIAEDTAVRIGNLAGADIIAIGDLNKVGSKFYLNIKLIMVETSELIGSSIFTANSEDEFQSMSKRAVDILLPQLIDFIP